MAVLDRAYADWKADQSRVLDRVLKDLSGHRHHLYVGGSTAPPPMVIDGALDVGGANITGAQAPDVPAFRIVGDLDIRMEMQHYGPSATMDLAAHNATNSTGRRWKVYRQGARLDFNFSPDGTNTTEVQVVGPAPDFTQRAWHRVTFELNVAGVWRVVFYTSTSYNPVTETGTWTTLQTTTGTVPGALTSQVAPLNLGFATTEGNVFRGAVYRFQLRSGVNGTIVASPDFTTATDGVGRIRDVQGNVWTLGNQPGWLAADGYHTPGAGTPVVSASSTPSMALTGKALDVRIELTPDTWRPANNPVLISKTAGASATDEWTFYLLASGILRFRLGNGTSDPNFDSPSAVPTTLTRAWLHLSLTAAGSLTFDYSTDYDPSTGLGTWTSLGTTGAAATSTVPFIVTAPLSTGQLPGVIHRFEVRIDGTLVANPDMRNRYGARRFLDSSNNEWVLKQSGGTTNDPLILTKESYDNTNLYLPGVTGNSVTTPNNVAFNPTDLDIRALIRPDAWGVLGTILAVDGGAGQMAWRFQTTTSQRLTFVFSVDGTTAITALPPTGSLPVIDGAAMWVRLTRIGSTGAITMQWSFDGTTWTTFYSPTLTAGALFASTAPLSIGAHGATTQTNSLTGRVVYAEVRNGVNGPIVASFDPSGMAVADTSHTDPQGNVWMVNRSTTGRKSVIVDRTKWMGGTDDFFEAIDHADLNAAANDSITAAMLSVTYGTGVASQGVLLGKQVTTSTATDTGYSLSQTGGVNNLRARVTDGTTGVSADFNGISGDDGVPTLTSLVRDGTAGAKRFYAVLDSLADHSGAGTADITTASLLNTLTLRIGRFAGTGTLYGNYEFIGAAFFREALGGTDLTSLKTELLSTGAGGPVAQTAAPPGIASANAFGNPSFTSLARVSPAGIGSAQVLGQPVVTSLARVNPAGIGSLQALGLPNLSSLARVSPVGIASQSAFGTALLKAAARISPAGLTSAEAFGLARVVPVASVLPFGVGSAEAFGSPVLHTIRRLDPTGIGSAEAFGLPVLQTAVSIFPAGIPSAEAVGVAVVGLYVVVVGISTAEAFGQPVLVLGVLDFFVVPQQMHETTGLVVMREASPAPVRLGGIMEMERRWP